MKDTTSLNSLRILSFLEFNIHTWVAFLLKLWQWCCYGAKIKKNLRVKETATKVMELEKAKILT